MQHPPPVDTQLTAQADRLVARMEQVPVSRFHGKVVGLLGTGTFFDSFDTLSISVMLSTLAVHLHLNAATSGWVISAGFLGQALGAIVFGLLSERLGRKRVFVVALGLLGLMAAGSAVAWDAFSLGTARFVQGLGLGAEVPVAAALLNEFVRGRARGRVLMLYKMLFPAGTLAASLVGALLLAMLPPEQSWRVLFAIGAIPLGAAVLAHYKLPESPRFLVRHGRTEQAERIVEEMERSADRSEARPVSQSPASADLAGTRFGEIFSPRYRSRTLVVWTLWFTTYFTLWGMTTWLPSLYVSVGHLSPSTASLLLGAVTIGYVGVLLAMSATVDRLGRRFWFLLGYTIAIAGALIALLLWWLDALHGWIPLGIAGTTLLLGVNINAPLVYLYTSELYPTRMRSWATMAGSSWRNIAAVVAPATVGQLLQAQLGIGAVFTLFLVVLLAGLVIQVAWGTETKQASLEQLAD